MIAARLAGHDAIVVELPDDIDAFNASRVAMLPDPGAADDLVVANIGLVRWVARDYANRRLSFTFGDLVGYGSVGLIRAAREFDPARGVKFSTYAVRCIRSAIAASLRNSPLVRRRRSHGATRDDDSTILESIEDAGAALVAECADRDDAVGVMLGGLEPSAREPVALAFGIGRKRIRQAAQARARGVSKQAVNQQIFKSFAELRKRFPHIGECA